MLSNPTLLELEKLCVGETVVSVDYLGTKWMDRLLEEQRACDHSSFGAFYLNNIQVTLGPHLIYGPLPDAGHYVEEGRLVARFCTGCVAITGDHGPNDVQKTVAQLVKLPSIIRLREVLKPIVGEVHSYVYWE